MKGNINKHQTSKKHQQFFLFTTFSSSTVNTVGQPIAMHLDVSSLAPHFTFFKLIVVG